MTENEDISQEELEKKISDAELQAQKEDKTGIEDSGSSFETVPEGEITDISPEKKGLSPGRKIWRKILIWLVVIAIAFAGGFFLNSTLRFQPEQERTAALQADLDDAQAEIASLEAEIERLGKFEDQNTTLTLMMDELNIHLVILGLRAGVADSALALEQGRQADAKLVLSKVGSSLDSLQKMLDADQGEVVERMIQRYQLIMIELDNDGATVLTDLELLASKLQTLENTLFAMP
jgi:hypothetical protein